MTDCTTISSKCLPALRRIAPSPTARCLPKKEPRGASGLPVQSSLREQIEREIRERGPIPFSRYMQICLYDPAHGYYSRQRRSIRQSRRLLHFKRRSRRLRTPAGAPVRRDMASARPPSTRSKSSNSAPAAACSPAMCSIGPTRNSPTSSPPSPTPCRRLRPRCEPNCKKLSANILTPAKPQFRRNGRT